MAKRPTNNGASWSAGELRTLKQLAKAGTAQAAAKSMLFALRGAVVKASPRCNVAEEIKKLSDALLQFDAPIEFS